MLLKKQLFPMFRRSRGAVKCEKSTLEKGVSNRESAVGWLNERARGAESGVKAAGLTGVDTGLDIHAEPSPTEIQPTPTEIRDGDKRADALKELVGPEVST